MDYNKKISPAVIKRLPRYYRYLSDLLENDVTRISSKELSKKMNVTASQIRQDLNCFGGFGQQGYGYNVESLNNEIRGILGVNNNFNYIIVGAGNMGRALANYKNFIKRGFNLFGIFDNNPDIVGTYINDVEVHHMDNIEDFIKTNNIAIAMLSLSRAQTPIVAENLAKMGIKGLWNFSPMDIDLPYDVAVENVHLSDSLMVLGYKISQNLSE